MLVSKDQTLNFILKTPSMDIKLFVQFYSFVVLFEIKVEQEGLCFVTLFVSLCLVTSIDDCFIVLKIGLTFIWF
jgi:hypothetical protein